MGVFLLVDVKNTHENVFAARVTMASKVPRKNIDFRFLTRVC